MRLFATWDVDRTTPSTVQRVFNMSVNRIVLDGVPSQVQSIVITAKLSESKRGRNLRTNDILIVPDHGRVDLDCDLSFSIQYPHFLKRKANCLQILIQRRRKYKNRLPGGFKTLAGGVINLTQVLQQGGLREITLWPAGSELQQKNANKPGLVQSVGRLILTSCHSQAVDQTDDRERVHNKKAEGAESEDDSDSDYDDMPMDSDLNEPGSARSDRRKLSRLIRRFKVPDDAQVAAEVASTSEARPPTKQELEALFEELSDFSDSGPEMVGDDVSIGSNPRPGLQPFFTRSREVLPAIYDREVDVSESEGEAEDACWSSETDNAKEKENHNNCHHEMYQANSGVGSYNGETASGQKSEGVQTPHKSLAMRVLSSGSAPSSAPMTSAVTHSYTMTSLSGQTPKSSVPTVDVTRGTSFSDKLSSLLDSDLSRHGDVVWISGALENCFLPSLTSSLPLVICTSSQNIRQTIVHIVNKIQNFCNSNSANPPLTWVGIIGGDRMFSQVLRVYVDCLAHKSSANWLQYLRFAPLPSTNSLLAKLIEGLDPHLDNLCRDFWDRWPDLSQPERSAVISRLAGWHQNSSATRVNLPIGEALLQLSSERISDREPEGGRIFIPFLCEVRVAINDAATVEEDLSSFASTSAQALVSPASRVNVDDRESSSASRDPNFLVSSSPPHSPHSRGNDVRELSLDYWINSGIVSLHSTPNLDGYMSTGGGTPSSKKDMGKYTTKSSFKSLLVSRILSGGFLSLTYVKEKRKEKMLQKLGMKKGQKAENESAPVQVSSICRMLCSASGKHSELNVLVDGVPYTGIRYFQTSPHWQTHVKAWMLMSARNGHSNDYELALQEEIENSPLRSDATDGSQPPAVEKVDGKARILRPQRASSPPLPHAALQTRPSLRVQSSQQLNVQPSVQQQNVQPSGHQLYRISQGNIIVHQPSHQNSQKEHPQTSLVNPGNPIRAPLNSLLQRKGNQKAVTEAVYIESSRKLLFQLRLAARKAFNLTTAPKETEKDKIREHYMTVQNIFQQLESLALAPVRVDSSAPRFAKVYNLMGKHVKDEPAGLVDENANQLFEDISKISSHQLRAASAQEALRAEGVRPVIHRSSLAQPRHFSARSPHEIHKQFIHCLYNVMQKEKSSSTSNSLTNVLQNNTHPNLETIFEVRFGFRRLRVFVEQLKAVLMVRSGDIVDISIGACREKLLDTNGIRPSAHECYRQISGSARAKLVGGAFSRLQSTTSFSLINVYLNYYVSCFTKKCIVCGKVMRDFAPPTRVILARATLGEMKGILWERGFPPLAVEFYESMRVCFASGKMVLAAVLSMLRYVGGSDDRDFVDRLHSYFTCNILIGLAVLVSFKQFGGKPVECLVPDMFSSSWEQYAENYCWASDTYYVPIGEAVAGLGDAERRQRKISYYQWVPFFLLMEAACFRLPSLLWRYLSGHSGIKIHEIVKLSSDPNNIKPDIKRANIRSLTVHLQGALRFHRRLQKKQIRPHKIFWAFNLPYSAFFVTSMYLCTKFFYLANVCTQLLLMNKFLETDKYEWYGFGALVDLLNGTTWLQSGVFPRVSLCDFDVRVMGNVQEHTIQCVLIINIFNEKIFILLWFWYLALVFFTFGSFMYWMSVSIFGSLSRRFIIRHLEMSEISFDSTEEGAVEKVRKFIDNYLKSDGVFVIRMMTLQSGVIFGTDLVQELWKNFYGSEQQLKRSNSMPGMEHDGELATEQTWGWPPPPPPAHPYHRQNLKNANALRWRRALGANTDNAMVTQDLLEKLVPPKDSDNAATRNALLRQPRTVAVGYEDAESREGIQPPAFVSVRDLPQPAEPKPPTGVSTFKPSSEVPQRRLSLQK
ncbi:unnamed protein product [Caenorhabditis auriculariae]|uniref:Innexin n=1 Tax=Caenorhabditis auriculariae TaxID=2777116 RepID=A0A8S1HKS2_9PELO|nr:unnamed protein product [Caenorhabditis auriculariae]